MKAMPEWMGSIVAQVECNFVFSFHPLCIQPKGMPAHDACQ